jgi:engulfment/cell motility protein 1
MKQNWGLTICRQIKDELHYEATQFMREQRIRCLLAGAWFPNHAVSSTYTNSLHPLGGNPPDDTTNSARNSLEYPPVPMSQTNAMKRLSAESNAAPATMGVSSAAQAWRYAILSHNRRQLHFADFSIQAASPPPLETLEHKVELAQVTKIDHTSSGPNTTVNEASNGSYHTQPRSQHTITLLGNPNVQPPQSPRKSRQTPLSTPATIDAPNPLNSTAISEVVPLLTLHPETSSLHSEWLYGLSVLITSSCSAATRQTSQKISHRPTGTKDALLDGAAIGIAEPRTERIIDFLTRYGGKLRMLNVSWEYEGVLNVAGNVGDVLAVGKRGSIGALDRRGLDDEFYYDVGGLEAARTAL